MNKYIAQINKIFSDFINCQINFHPDRIFKEILEYVLGDVSQAKRLRPFLAAIFCEKFFNLDINQIKNFIIAIELIHNYSLIHDDLPAIDNDDFRRGKLSVHKKFGEHNAILFADSLHSLAFELISHPDNCKNFTADIILKIVYFFSQTIGGKGLIYGETLDINCAKGNINNITIDYINLIHYHKTAQIFGFCTSLGALLSGKNEKIFNEFYQFGIEYGLVFQLIDDIDDYNKLKNTDELNILKYMNKSEVLQLINEKILIIKNFILQYKLSVDEMKFFDPIFNILDSFKK